MYCIVDLFNAGDDFEHEETILVRSGGYCPHNEFDDACDELEITVFHNMMVTCVTIQNTESMKASFEAEVYDNLARIRHHASLALIIFQVLCVVCRNRLTGL